MPVSFYDPDESDQTTQSNALKPKTKLQEMLMEATRSRRFKNNQQRNKFKELEAKSLGARPEHLLYEEWIKHNIDLARKANSLQTIRSKDLVIAAIANEERRIAWVGTNKEKILKERAQEAIKSFYGGHKNARFDTDTE